MGDILGGSESSSESKNLAYPWIKDNFGSSGSGAFNTGAGMLSKILGGNSAVANGALDRLWDSSGGKFLMDKGLDNVTARLAKLGLTHSGSAMTGFEDYRQGLASTKLNELLQNYMGLGQLGLGAGGLVANAGQVSKGSGSQSGGLGSLLGAAMMFL